MGDDMHLRESLQRLLEGLTTARLMVRVRDWVYAFLFCVFVEDLLVLVLQVLGHEVKQHASDIQRWFGVGFIGAVFGL
jgi:hypothetical protein